MSRINKPDEVRQAIALALVEYETLNNILRDVVKRRDASLAALAFIRSNCPHLNRSRSVTSIGGGYIGASCRDCGKNDI